MDISIAVVEDRETDRDTLLRDIRGWRDKGFDRNGTEVCYSSGESMLENFEPGKIRLVFMDIYMGKLNGIETARELRARDPGILIVFLTTSRDFAFDAFPVHPFDYIVKPYEVEKLCLVLDEAQRVVESEDASSQDEIKIPIRITQSSPVMSKGIYDVRTSKVSAVMSRGHTVEVSMTDGQSLTSSMAFSEVEKLLSDDPRFLTCNRGVIVNMDQVDSLTDGVFCMKNGSKCSIRVRGRTKTVSDFSQYRITKMRGSSR